ncbi:MAG: hypothetical protein GX541_03975 [Clostridiales bacterium]|nr:hypothetical protein [Clostridiales bacterium]
MTSRERMLNAFRRIEVDHIPLSIYFNPKFQKPDIPVMKTVTERVEFLLKLVDPVIDVKYLDTHISPEVKTGTWIEDSDDKTFKVLYKEYVTPAGTLRQGVRYNEDWPFGMDIPLPGADFCGSHHYEPLIKSPDDVRAFEYLYLPPTQKDVDNMREHINEIQSIAKKYNVLVRTNSGFGLANFLFMMGAQNMIMFAIDYPEVFKKLVEIDHRANLARIKLCPQLGVDVLRRFGGYEMTNFLSVGMYNGILKEFLIKEVEAAHSENLLIYYRVVSGAKPLLDTISEIGFDCVEGFEPELSDCTNSDIKAALSDKCSIWTGVSSPGHIGAENDTKVRAAVRNAIETFGRRGFILGVSNSIRSHWPFENVLAMIDEWKKLR